MTFRAPTPLPRRLARRARRHLGLPCSRVCVLPVEGGAWLDVSDRAGVWFSAAEWAAFALDAVGLLVDLAGDDVPADTRAALAAAVAAATGP